MDGGVSAREAGFYRAGFMIVENWNRRTCGAQANVPVAGAPRHEGPLN